MNWLPFRKHLSGVATFRKIGRDEWLYRNSEREMRIYAEMLAGGEGVEIDFSAMRNWLAPHEQEPLVWEQRRRVLQEFCDYLTQRKIRWQLRK